ncbi:LytR/AlgR family response regulator transcription factor [Pseudohongiella spirulinae]|uniref:Response regulator n=1 Tax=Pseudohongiella spirulinae TaxID=1249552 RepID=A0A0S2KC07_9GAMM|nr:LytTR family DNA-binding domain-containing protein [Pseudohongiella spirulinae]ALO45862.1 Response regulator [Pseudohongiella spirulinae]
MKSDNQKHSLRAVIVDDETLARQGLELRLAELGGVEVVRSCKNGREALEAVAELTPDLLFLDIQMPGMNGFEVVESLQQDNMPLIVFVTAYDEFAVSAFEVHAVDYLLKPIETPRLAQALDKVRERLALGRSDQEKRQLLDIVIGLTGRSEQAIAELMKSGQSPGRFSEKLAIKDGSSTTFVPVRDIDWIDAAGDYMCVHVKGETHIMRTTMKELESLLDPAIFQRVHRSTIVNLDRVEKVSSHINGEFHLTLSCGASLKMSRSYKDKVKHFF